MLLCNSPSLHHANIFHMAEWCFTSLPVSFASLPVSFAYLPRPCPSSLRAPSPPPLQFIVSQTNPWVVPFLPDNDQLVADMPMSLQGITSRVIHVVVAQIR